MYRFRKTFFSEKRANAFAAMLEGLGCEVERSSQRDYLNNGTLYIVSWNKD